MLYSRMEQSLSPSQHLDEVLTYLISVEHVNPTVTDGDIFSYMQKKFPEAAKSKIDRTEVHRRLDKLIDEKRIKRYGREGAVAPFKYGITFDGKLFIEQGGYHQQELDRKANALGLELENSQNQLNQILLVIGAMGAALGAIALVIWEIYKYFHLEHH
jgi:DNA-binding Lrp family transcriptional regulator